MAKLIKSVEVDGPTRVRVLHYDDGSVRFRVYAAPLAITEAFLSGGRNDFAIIKLVRR